MDSTLYTAATKADIDVLKRYKDQLLNQISFPAKQTVLHVLAQHNESPNAIEKILSDLDFGSLESLLISKNSKGETALYIAARNRHKDIVDQLITSARALSTPDLEDGHGLVSLVSRMARLANDNGDTPLHEAVNNKDVDIVKSLVDADPDYQHLPNNMGKTPLYIALEKRKKDDGSNRGLLASLGNSMNTISSYDHTLVSMFDVCKSPGTEGPHGETILHAATRRKGTFEWISQICKRFPDIRTKQDMEGFTPLHNAAHYNNPSVVKVLLEADKFMAYITAAEDKHESMTPLHIAASKGHTKVMEEISKNCQDCWYAVTSKGQNILHLAAKGQHTASIKSIIEQPWARNLLNMKDDDGNTPAHLLLSSMPENYKKIKHLLEEPNVNADAFNNQHSTPLEMLTKGDNQFITRKVTISKKLEKKFGRVEKIPWMIDDGVSGNSKKEVEKTQMLEDMKKTAETQLVVASLIATVTFAAGFTLPGGYDGDGPNQGTAVLIRKAAFKAFVVTDTIAVMSSFASIFVHFIATLYNRDEKKIVKRYKIALLFLIIAMISMAITFVTGLCVVLEKSPTTTTMVGIIGCLGIIFLLYLIRKVYRDMGPSIYYSIDNVVLCRRNKNLHLSKTNSQKGGGISKSNMSRFVKRVHAVPWNNVSHDHQNV